VCPGKPSARGNLADQPRDGDELKNVSKVCVG
jgi:hypothetical protein